jgi:ADP-ribosylation factor-binding protein GGA
MCEEESDDAEAVAKLLEINDSIHRTVQRYKLMKAGDVEAATKIPKGTLGTTTGVGKNAANELSLIDFDPEQPAAPSTGDMLNTSSGAGKPTTVEDDLLSLSMNDSTYGQTGGISLGGTNNGSVLFSARPPQAANPMSAFSTPSAVPQPPKANYDAFAALTSSLPTSKPVTPAPLAQQSRLPASQAPAAVDPFAALISGNSRPNTPSKRRNGVNTGATATTSLLDLAQESSMAAPAQRAATNADDEWNFASALPEPSQPTSNTLQVHVSSIKIDFTASRAAGQQQIHIQSHFSNQTMQRISGLHFQVAVEKAYSLQLRPQTGRELSPGQKNGVQQEILLSGVPPGKGDSVKMRFKVSYQLDGKALEEQGTVPSLGIA